MEVRSGGGGSVMAPGTGRMLIRCQFGSTTNWVSCKHRLWLRYRSEGITRLRVKGEKGVLEVQVTNVVGGSAIVT